MSDFEHRESIERHNQADRLDIERSVEEMRGRFIASVFQGVKNYWKLQEDNFDTIAVAGYPDDAVYEYYVLPAYTGFPFEEEEPVLSLSLYLKPKSSDGTEGYSEENRSSMTVFVPLPEGTVVNENLEVDELPEPTKIAVKYVSPGGMPMDFVIDTTGTSPFVNAVDSGDQAVELDEIDEALQRLVEGGVKIREEVEIIPRLFRSWVDWKARIQKTIPVREADSQG